MDAPISQTLALFSGYWQIPVAEHCKGMTSFTCKFGTIRFEVMRFGLMNALATFQSIMNEVLRDPTFARVYLDDVVIFSKDLPDHTDQVITISERISRAGLHLKLKKCKFTCGKVQLLGHIDSREGIRVDFDMVQATANAQASRLKTEQCSFLVRASYYRRFINTFARIAAPLHSATAPWTEYVCNDQINAAFVELERRLFQLPILANPNFQSPFTVETDASSFAVGAILLLKK